MKKLTFKNITGILLILLGIYSIVYCFSIMIYRVNFSKFFLLLGVVLIIIGLIIVFFKEIYLPQKLKFILKPIKILLIFTIVVFIIIEGLIIYNGCKKDTAAVDYLVVLGAGLWGDTPSLALQERLDESIKFIKENPHIKVVLSGGKGPGETITEAEGMRRYLISKGIDNKLLIKEEKSTNTKENMQFSKSLLKEIDGRENLRIKIVTNNFHMFRAKLIARNSGFTAFGQPAELFAPLIPMYYTRECLAVIKTLIFDLR
ncbi:YdcF family protein [Candidatus Clostridium radicumherbarum]|uniref:YdcF family protein n=1 Tax=Candidatus Clostridium radicumherbarum TaxID=3381662 RepID=A0ABW8TN58_9CLOT